MVNPKKLDPTSLISRNFKSLRKVLMNHAEALKSKEWRRILVLKTFKIKIQEGATNDSAILQDWLPTRN